MEIEVPNTSHKTRSRNLERDPIEYQRCQYSGRVSNLSLQPNLMHMLCYRKGKAPVYRKACLYSSVRFLSGCLVILVKLDFCNRQDLALNGGDILPSILKKTGKGRDG